MVKGKTEGKGKFSAEEGRNDINTQTKGGEKKEK